eukprot:Rhum_TRINITY_DN18713_c0_g1::Rhum_TRINITY_DN18713_c0_g1_i1::g.168217::m.168217
MSESRDSSPSPNAAATAATAVAAAAALAGESELLEIERDIDASYEDVLLPLDQFGLIRRKERCKYPMVLVIGNYSSGKSTFVNSLVGNRLAQQEVGAAPTDSGFTLLLKTPATESTAPGDVQLLQGSGVLNNPQLGFSDLKRFGPALEARLKLKQISTAAAAAAGGGGGGSGKYCSGDLPENVVLVDTPGLTDFDSYGDELFSREAMHSTIQWFASRSDLILFLFDPLKLGGDEQRDLLLRLLKNGLEGKMKFVFNKVDQLTSTQDFAMTFGTMCWNLSKYVPRKEPPMFYTTFSPGCDGTQAGATKMDACLDECRARRRDLLRCIAQVPFERADNLIKGAEDATERLFVASFTLNELLRRAGRRRQLLYGLMTVLSSVLVVVFLHLYAIVETESPLSSVLLYAVLLIMGFALVAGYAARAHLHAYYDHLIRDALDDCFLRGFHTAGGKEFGQDDSAAASSSSSPASAADAPLPSRPTQPSESTDATWQQLKKTLDLTPADLRRLGRVRPVDLRRLSATASRLRLLHSTASTYRRAMGRSVSRSPSPDTPAVSATANE